MLEVQRPPMATHNADGSPSRLRPVSVDSYHSSFSLDSYISSTSSLSASSTYVHARSIYSVSDSHAETEESAGSSIDVQRPDTPPQDFDTADHVLCMFDFDSDDPDHMSFKQNDILKVIAKEPSGWWAAQVGDRVGWIPSAFVVVLLPDMLQRLEGVAHDLRVYEYEAEALYNGTSSYDGSPPNDEVFFESDDEVQVITTAFDLLSPGGFPSDVTPGPSHFENFPFLRSSIPGLQVDSLYNSRHSNAPRTPRTPIPPTMPAPAPSNANTVMSQHQIQLRQQHPLLRLNTTPLMVNKPTPPTPVSPTPISTLASKSSSGHFPSPILPRSRSLGSSSISTGSSPSTSSRRWPDILSPGSLKNSSSIIGSLSSHGDSSREIQSLSSSLGSPVGRDPDSARRGKMWRNNGDSDAQVFHSPRVAQVQQPWYLRPDHTGDEIRVEHDGSVKAGTLAALVERLAIELPASELETFRHTFLTTFHTFTTADAVLELLIERYNMDPPGNLATEQFHEWLEKKFKPTQTRVLNLFTLWVEQYGMVEDDPQVIPRLQEFLGIISASVPHAQSARQILQAIEQHRRDLNTPYLTSSAPTRKSSKRHKNDLLKIDHNDLARQLTLYEARLYLKVRPHECLTWVSNQKGESVRNLRAFISTSDKLAAWVKMSVLSNDALGRRADTIDLWIRVAEKCRGFNNLSSMSAIVAALMSPVILKLQLTWAHVNRSSHIQPLAKLGEPVNNFGAYRSIYSSVEGPCIPYIGMYLNDMVKVDCIKNNIDPRVDINMIDFAKRQKMGEVTNAILRHQPKIRDQLKFSEIPSIFEFVENQLKIASSKDEGSFWMRSQDVQQAEIAHADIRRGLEAAGF